MLLAVLFSFSTKAQAQDDYIDIQSSAASSGVYYLGHCLNAEPQNRYTFGLDADATIQLYARMARSKMRKFKDAKVAGVRIAVVRQIDVKVFLKQEINTDIIVSKDVTLFPGWNEVYFDEPLAIEEKSLCYGFEHTIEYSGAEIPNPIPTYAVDGQKETANSDAFYWVANNKSPESYAKKFGNLLVQLIISNPPTFTRDMGNIDYLEMPTGKDADGTSTFRVAMRNVGSNPIENYTLSYSINEGAATDVEVKGTLSEQTLRLLTISGVNAEKGDVLKVNLKSVNGVDRSADPGVTEVFDVSEKSFKRKIFLEHFTTEKCGNCPRKDKVLHSVIDNFFKEDVVWTAHHVGFYTDFLTLEDSNDLLFLYGDGGTYCPAMALNRMSLFEDVVEPVISVPEDEEFLQSMLIAAKSIPAPLGLTVKAGYDKEAKEIVAQVYGEIDPSVISADDCMLHVWAVEDYIKPQNQAGAKDDPEFVHKNVVRYMANGAAGTALTVDGDDKFDMKVVIPFDEKWVSDNVRVVAFISRPIDDPSDISVYNADQTQLSEHQGIEQVGTDSEFGFVVAGRQIVAQGISSADIKVYTMDGTMVPNHDLKPGVYVAKADNSGVQKVVVK